MHVKKIYNNNLVGSIDESGNEVIVYGKGIGFGLKKNDLILEDDIEKIYRVNDGKLNDKLKQVINSIPIEFVNLASDIIHFLESKMGHKIKDGLLITLSDHLYSLSERQKQAYFLPNSMLWEIKRLYPKEFSYALESLDMIEKCLGFHVPEDEAGFITFHIISAELEESVPMIIDITEFIKDVKNICNYYFQISLDENSVNFSRFVTHLQFLARSIFNKDFNNQGKERHADLSRMIFRSYPDSYKCVQIINDYVVKKYNYTMAEEELSYLTIHVQRMIMHD